MLFQYYFNPLIIMVEHPSYRTIDGKIHCLYVIKLSIEEAKKTSKRLKNTYKSVRIIKKGDEFGVYTNNIL